MRTETKAVQAFSTQLAQEERRLLTLEGIADVDSENVIDQQAVQAWAESLNYERLVSWFVLKVVCNTASL